jgi:protein-disulfide isomerase
MRLMARATTAKTIPTETKPLPKSEKAHDHFVLRIPRLNFKNGSLNAYLVFVVVVFAFLLGMLTNKVLFLENQVKNNANANTAAANPQAAIPTAVPPPAVVKVDNGHLPARGDANAKVTIVEFSDFQCPFCKQYFDQTDSQIQDQYVKTGKVKFYYRQYPLTSIHPNAEKSAEASECANEQNQFWAYHDLLFKNQDTWSPMTSADAENSFVDYATQLGMDADQFRSCIDLGKYKKQVDDDATAGNKVQVDGTPAFFINGNRLVGAQPFSEFQKLIDEELKK